MDQIFRMKKSNICCIIHRKIRGDCEDIVGYVTTPNDTFMQLEHLIQTHLYSHEHIYQHNTKSIITVLYMLFM